MKKSRVISLLSLSVIFSLVGCNKEETSSSGENSSSISSSKSITNSSSSKEGYVAEDSIEGLIDTILRLRNKNNFTAKSDTDNSEFIFTKSYYKKVGAYSGYVNLPYHKDETRKLSYKVEIDKEGNPTIESLGYYTDIYGERHELDFSNFNLFINVSDSLASSSFVSKNGVYSTDDNGVLLAFKNFYSTSDIAKVSFWFDNGNSTLNYEIFNAANSSLATGSFFDIDITKDEKLENLVNSFSWDKDMKALTPDIAGNLLAVNSSSTTDIYRKSLYSSGEEHIARVNFKCNEDTIYINSIDDPDGNKSEYVTYLKKRESDERVISYGLNAQNKETQTETRYFFSQYTLPSQLDLNDFRLCADGTYKYFSLDPNIVYQTFAHVTVNDSTCSFEDIVLKLSDNKVSSIEMTSLGEGLKGYTYIARTTLNTYEDIVLPTSYEDNKSREITRAMSVFDGTSSFKVTKSNDQKNPTRKTTYTFDGTTYLIETETKSSSEWDREVNGYTRKDDGTILPFRMLKKSGKLVQSEDIVENDTITNHFPNLIDPYTVKKNSDGSYSFRELINEISDTLWISNNVEVGNLVMNINSQGFISEIKYGVLYSSDDAEYLNFEYSDISIPSDIDINNIGPMELTSYSEDSPEEWEDLVTYIGEEYASLIPYYYDKKCVGKWYAEPRYSSGTGVPDINDKGEVNYDDPLIGIGLYCAGSSVPTSVLDDLFIEKGFSRVTSGLIDVGYRDDDYVANGYEDNIRYVDASKQTVFEIPGKLRVVYDSDVAFMHFSPKAESYYVLSSGLLIQRLDGVEINRNGTFH